MLSHADLRDPIFINTVGHSAGLLLFGLIIVLLSRDWRAYGSGRIKLPLIAASLALCWNLGALIALGAPASRAPLIGIVLTASFSVLSLLPAVLLQVALQKRHPLLVVIGYGVSASAVVLHSLEAYRASFGPHQAALAFITVGFGALTAAALLQRYRHRRDVTVDRSEWISLGCLVLFTSSFLHFGYEHISSPWPTEITWHHLGIPVVLIVLLRDYRFLLLDTFIRFLVNSALAALYLTLLLLLWQRLFVPTSAHSGMFAAGIALVLVGLSLILFAHLRNLVQRWVSRVIFRRRSIDQCIKAIVKLSLAARSEDELLSLAAAQVASYLQADRFAVTGAVESRETGLPILARGERRAFLPRDFHPEANIPLRFSAGDARILEIGVRRGGQRYFSEDLAEMRQLGGAIVEQVERFRAEELRRLVSQAELRELQAQINPHFLFNALNTLYGTIDRRSHQARRMVLNLADIFRYCLQGDRTVIALSEELRIIEAYLEIETLRLGDRLQTTVVAEASTHATMIPILSLQPLVENAVKHGVAAKDGGGHVMVRAEHTAAGLLVTVADTGVGFDRSRAHPQNGMGRGLDNVRRRLAICYGPAADLAIVSSDAGSTVMFLVPRSTPGVHKQEAVEVGV
jgi:two-component system, LytTR family, sensor kinase